MPRPCLSPKFDALIGAAVHEHWRDFPRPEWWKAQLCQESHLNPDAVSPVGAEGLAQIMPATQREIARALNWDSALTAFNPRRAIDGGAWYQGGRRRGWGEGGRTGADRNRLGLCSYNAGFGNCLKAQKACGGARLWEDIAPCMPLITGDNARETMTYVDHITQYAREIDGRH